VINYRGERDNVEEDAVDALDNVDAAVEIGGFVDVFFEGWLGTLTVTQDVADGHDGLLVELGAGYWMSLLPQLALTTVVTGSYADDNYMDTYFGIDADDALASGLGEFDADAGFKDVGVTLELVYELSSTWGLAGIASYQRLLDDAADSPVVNDVGDEDQFFGGVVVSYSF
jgi:outer membrane scaffolding protein for murein synthesis (MipA/OmpV family)